MVPASTLARIEPGSRTTRRAPRASSRKGRYVPKSSTRARRAAARAHVGATRSITATSGDARPHPSRPVSTIGEPECALDEAAPHGERAATSAGPKTRNEHAPVNARRLEGVPHGRSEFIRHKDEGRRSIELRAGKMTRRRVMYGASRSRPHAEGGVWEKGSLKTSRSRLKTTSTSAGRVDGAPMRSRCVSAPS